MISEPQPDRPRARTWLWPGLISLAVHAIVVPWALWAAGLRLPILRAHPQRPELVLSATVVRLERRPVPAPRTRAAAPAPPRVAPRRPAPALAPVPTPMPRELARIVPSAPPQPTPPPASPQPPSQPAQSLLTQERTYAREVARLNRSNNPLSIATPAAQPPAAYHRSAFDAPGKLARSNDAQALLLPVRHWFVDGLSCYYTRYVAEFSNGASERGLIPWPVCYPQDDDRIAALPYPHPLPIPYPQPGYVLPPGTYLSQFLRSIYLHQR